VITGVLVSKEIPDVAAVVHKSWFWFAAFLGCSFFCIFNLMGYVANNIGVTVTSVASKLSMVIPVTVAVFLYHDSITPFKLIAVALALAAVCLSSITEESHEKHLELRGLFFAFIIFLASGMNDSLVNYSSVKLMSASEFNAFNIVIFSFASLCGICTLLFQRIFQQESIPLKAIAGGVLLGVHNYFSLLFLIKALNIPGWHSSVIFPINNMGVVALTAVCAYLLFREKLSKKNLIGIALALIAIAMIIFA
jgi:drug/metabolite transporter (DMT)-like permease